MNCYLRDEVAVAVVVAAAAAVVLGEEEGLVVELLNKGCRIGSSRLH